jgi:hypothetical protein
MFTKSLFLAALSLFAAHAAFADEADDAEFNPFAANVEQTLQSFDAAYEATTGLSAHPTAWMDMITSASGPGCRRESCAIFVDVDKSSQTLRLYVNGRFTDQYPTSTGRASLPTPNFDKHFDGRIFQGYSSSKFPGGDYNGLGNMPYAMFISGGVAIHGVPQGEWSMLGRPASHGCIRIHPDHARVLNGMLRSVGVANSWVYVH